MRALLAVMFLLCSLSMPARTPAQEVAQPPDEADIPKPVPAEISLAGAERPDIARFLNVRSASAPSLSPDGGQLAFRTSLTTQR